MINIIPSSIKKIIFCTLFLVPVILSAQVNLKTIRKASWQTFVYRIPADSAEKYLEKDTIPVDQFLNQLPAYVFPKDSVNEDSISNGNYVLVSVNDNNIVSRIINKTNLFVYPIDNKYRSQIEVRNDKAEFINDAKVFINDKLIPFNAVSHTYWISQKRNKSAFIKVYASGDTTFLQLNEDNNKHQSVPVWKQRWKNFKITGIGKSISNASNAVIRLFVKKNRR